MNGSLLRTRVIDASSPIAYGVADSLAVFTEDGKTYALPVDPGGRGGRGAVPVGRGAPTRTTGTPTH